ncbi:MAG: SAM-dependent chlorinase/fluorinase, partial [Oscillospiraceae bacterium]|nr:SAM-dependent chlorinase/fluorinase [Oscillospiraceae bacterium]
MGYVVIQTDFGRGGSGAMAGVCKLVDRSVRVYNITHEVPQFDVVA